MRIPASLTRNNFSRNCFKKKKKINVNNDYAVLLLIIFVVFTIIINLTFKIYISNNVKAELYILYTWRLTLRLILPLLLLPSSEDMNVIISFMITM